MKEVEKKEHAKIWDKIMITEKENKVNFCCYRLSHINIFILLLNR